MVTMKDVAEHAHVSVATVSNYLNATKPVGSQTIERIKRAIDELRYTQNFSAKSLKSNVYSDIAVILPNLNDSYYVQIFQGIEARLQNSSYYLNLMLSNDIPELEKSLVQNMLKKQVCALILITSQPDQWKYYYENFTKCNRPIVLIDRAIQSLDTNMISFDSHAAMSDITGQLLEMNYRKISMMAGPESFSCEEACVDGFKDAYSQASLDFPRDMLIRTDLNKEDAFRKTITLLRSKRPEIMLSTSELVTSGIIEGLRLLDIAWDEIPVITLGEEHWNKNTQSFASFSVPRPAIKIGEQAASMLFNKLLSPQTQENEQILIQYDSLSLGQRLKKVLTAKKTSRSRQSKGLIRVLMLDTPLVHTFCNLLKNFECASGITVEVSVRPHHSLYQAILDSFNSNDKSDLFDVFMYDIPWLSKLVASGILDDISTKLSKVDTARFLPGSMKYYSEFRKKFYGIPFMYAPQILYYRKDLFDNLELQSQFSRQYGSSLKPPLTFKEFNAIADFFTNKSDAIAYGSSIAAAYDECLAPELYMRMRAYSSEVLDAHGNVLINNPNTLKAYISFIRASRFAKPDFMQATDVSVVDDFLKGETAMLISYPAFLTDVADLRKSSMIGSIGYSHIPGRRPLLGGWGLGINSRSESKNSAFDFINWTCSDQMVNYFSMLGGYSAVTNAYTNDELSKLYPWLSLYKKVYQYTKPMIPPIIKMERVVSPNEIDSIICKWVYKMMEETIDISDVLLATQYELETLING